MTRWIRSSRKKHLFPLGRDHFSQARIPGQHIGTHMRWVAVMQKEAYQWNSELVAKSLFISPRSIRRILQRHDESQGTWGENHRPMGRESGRTIMRSIDQYKLLQIINQEPTSYLCELQRSLEIFSRIKYSFDTIARILYHFGMSHKRLSRSSHLASLRLRVAYRHQLWTWVTSMEQLVFIDESSKNQEAFSRQYGWGPVNRPLSNPNQGKIGKRKSVLGAYCFPEGMLLWQSIEETYNQERFEDWFINRLLPCCGTKRQLWEKRNSLRHRFLCNTLCNSEQIGCFDLVSNMNKFYTYWRHEKLSFI